MIRKKISLVAVTLLVLFTLVVFVSGILSTNIGSILLIMKSEEFRSAVIFTLITSLSSVILSALMAVPAAFFLSRHSSGVSVVMETLLELPIVIPPLIAGVFLLSLFSSELITEYFDFVFTVQGAVAAQFFVSFPLTLKSAKTGFESVPEIYELTAMSLGKKPLKAFYDTTFKLALPGITAGLTLTWLRSIGEFGATLLVGGGIPGRTENIPVNIYINMSSCNYSLSIAASVISFCCVALISVMVKLVLLKKGRTGF